MSEALPPTSLRAEQAARRESFKDDTHAASSINEVTGLVIGLLFLNFIAVILFGTLGTDATELCTDTTNFTADDCDQATTIRGFFWIGLIVGDLALILLIFAVARKSMK